MRDAIRTHRDGPVATIVLNRPEKRTALTLELIRTLHDALQSIAADRSIRVVVLGAEGSVFCAGHDLSEMSEMDEAGLRALFTECSRLMIAIHSLPQPVLARVQGAAVAGGCHLVATCDLAVASDRATFAVPGPRIGLSGSTAMVELARAAGRKRAMHLLLTGEAIGATTAAEWGLVNSVVPAEELDQSANGLATRVASASGDVLLAAKRALFASLDLTLADACALAAAEMASSAAAPSAREGIAAFLEHRAPIWPS